MPLLAAYDNYRDYLKDWYQHSKNLSAKVSFRFLSQRTGLNSPNYWKLVMEGKRKLSNEMIPRFARTLKLRDIEAHYFHHLVLMNQAVGIKERALHAQHLADLKKRLSPPQVGAPEVNYFSRWYLPVLREAAVICGKHNSVAKIRARLRIRLDPSEIEEGMRLLVEGGHLGIRQDGSYFETQKLLSTGDRVTSALALRYLIQMIEESLPALEDVPATSREYGAQTLSLGPKQFERLKTLARDFRKEALRLAEESACESQSADVIQMNLQIFPLTQELKETKL